jgi:hypothetical protein
VVDAHDDNDDNVKLRLTPTTLSTSLTSSRTSALTSSRQFIIYRHFLRLSPFVHFLHAYQHGFIVHDATRFFHTFERQQQFFTTTTTVKMHFPSTQPLHSSRPKAMQASAPLVPNAIPSIRLISATPSSTVISSDGGNFGLFRACVRGFMRCCCCCEGTEFLPRPCAQGSQSTGKRGRNDWEAFGTQEIQVGDILFYAVQFFLSHFRRRQHRFV